ncbi:head scaffolding protein [Mycobacterium phage Hawkeye]|uniref:Scaffolding protein n=1 Tax=Mycobacterium phage Hawkeye TaxID=1458711 RepID=X2KN47_9CAUD|nr:head scaffolding protein [Mycobacterium phage Hawkeye]AHN84027.1 hypothetical protein PBI_HAWKEYE_16 [Mycobacterium phage Hawkeye]
MTTNLFIDWLLAAGIALSGHDDDDSGIDSGFDSDVDDDADGSDGDPDDRDDDGDFDDSDGDDRDFETELKDAKKELREVKRDLADALEMLEENESNSGDYDDDTEVSELRKENEAMRALLNGPYIQSQINGFRNKDGSPRWDWEDTETVYALLHTKDLEVDVETGEIDGLEDQLEELAKKKPFLLRKKNTTRGSSGKPPGDTGNGSKKKPTAKDLASDFSAFNSLGF